MIKLGLSIDEEAPLEDEPLDMPQLEEQAVDEGSKMEARPIKHLKPVAAPCVLTPAVSRAQEVD